MFIQVIKGRTAKAHELRNCFDQWATDLAPAAKGWLGTTAGVTPDGMFMALIRFDSQKSARANNERPEQHQWWMATSKNFNGDVTFHDCAEVDQFGQGGSDDAGYVQVIEGRVRDAKRMRELGRMMEAGGMNDARPDVIGGTMAMHGDGGYTMAVYFTSEQEAMAAQDTQPPANLRAIIEEERGLHMAEPSYYDLTQPWMYWRR
ncbi:hypothetical protein J5X84_26570 [Streptosporangiaceae bacterium NEAU-GS5]|nr:hypothetical protein [Streptosporangiaceae bacterium NEAU-GS5]